jgi:nicotinic acid mononucleotide adenylyltransferase
LHSGDFAPIALGDITLLEVAKKYLESEQNVHVAGALLSPSHDQHVRVKQKDSFVPSKYRLTMLEEVVKDSEWIDIDTWEVVQTRVQPVGTVANRLINAIREKITGHKSLSLCYVTTAAALIRSPLAGFDNKLVSVCVVGTSKDKEKVDPIKQNYEKNHGIKMYFVETEQPIVLGEKVIESFKLGSLTEEQVAPGVLKYLQKQLLGGYALQDSDL